MPVSTAGDQQYAYNDTFTRHKSMSSCGASRAAAGREATVAQDAVTFGKHWLFAHDVRPDSPMSKLLPESGSRGSLIIG